MRFHSLPNSEPYPETEQEHREYLYRHHAALAELGGTGNVLVVTAATGASPRPRRTSTVAAVTGPAHRWHTFEAQDSEPGWPLWVSWFVSGANLSGTEIDPLLLLVAHEQASGVIFAPADFTWLYHPYEAGADVLLPTSEARDALRQRHACWLSPYPGGL